MGVRQGSRCRRRPAPRRFLPRGHTMSVTLEPARPVASDPVEAAFAELLAKVLKVEHVSADQHFFDELGADSLLMAQFCARVRKRGGLPALSMRDVYAHPT